MSRFTPESGHSSAQLACSLRPIQIGAGLSAAGQRETPSSFSMSTIIGCVKPALLNSAKSSTMPRSQSLLPCSERGSPLWAR